MFKVGDLVRYKKKFTNNRDYVGLVIAQNPVFRQLWRIQWLNGTKYQESETNLELVKK